MRRPGAVVLKLEQVSEPSRRLVNTTEVLAPAPALLTQQV